MNSTAKTATNHAELWLRADSDCSDPTDPAVLASHPGRLAAIRIDDDEVVLAQDRLRSWPLFWALEDLGGPEHAGDCGTDPGKARSGRRLVISDDSTLMRGAVTSPRLESS